MRIFRNLFFSLFALVLCVDLVFHVLGQTGLGIFNIQSSVFQPSRDNFYGFESFFDKVSSFPGMNNLLRTVNDTKKYLSGEYDSWYEAVSNVMRVIVTPFTIFVSILADILENIIWLLTFIIPVGYLG